MICPACKGNGYIRAYRIFIKIFSFEIKKKVYKDCNLCRNQGELKILSSLFRHHLH
jgi:hypothetical protein